METDVSLPDGVALRGSIYHLQIKVPKRLQASIGRTFWVRTSLGTGSKTTAALLAHRHWAEATAAFAAADAKLKPPEVVPLTPALSQYIVAQAGREGLMVDEALRFHPGALVDLLRAVEPSRRPPLWAPGDPEVMPSEYLKPSPDGSLTPAQAERLREIAQLSVDDLAQAMTLGRLGFAKSFAEAACASLGIAVDWSAPSARQTLVEVLRASLMGWIGAVDRSEGKPVQTPALPEAPAKATPSAKAPKDRTLQDAFDAWKVGKKPDAINKTRRALAMVEAAGIRRSLGDLSRQDAFTFREHLSAVMEGRTAKTRSNTYDTIQALLNYVVTEKGWLESNPWKGTTIAKGRAAKRIPWSDAELRTLLHSPTQDDRRVDRNAQYWLPLLAILTGARQAELCQLNVSDVIERDGVWLLDINEEGDAKSVKSAAGVRWVAVHSKLIELGFLDHVQAMRKAGARQVFPGILRNESRPASVYVSDWFRDRCQALGIYKKLRDFHAFRTTVGTALRGVHPPLPEALITAVMGHEAGNVGMANYYNASPAELKLAIESLDFPSVKELQRLGTAEL